MFKKIVLYVCCISPLLFVFFTGYPVKTYEEKKRDGFVLTKRCFKVGEFVQFMNCFSSGKVLSRQKLVSDVGLKLDSLFPRFNIIFFLSLALLFVLMVSFIF